MRTKALRLYGKGDLRLDAFDLPPVGEDELLVKIVSDSLCMSSYKAVLQGEAHKRVPDDVAQNPVVIGHEFCGEVLEVGARASGQFRPGQTFAVQPALPHTYDAAGYSFPCFGGCMQYGIVPARFLEEDCMLPYDGDAYFCGSLAEPVSCVIAAARTSYHTKDGAHHMGIREGGNAALLAGAGPMGLGMLDYLLHGDRRPETVVVTDIDEARLARAAALIRPKDAKQSGIRLVYLNTGACNDPVTSLKTLCSAGFDDVFVFAPVESVIMQADAILSRDGCLNFFAGPTDPAFSARLNFYDVHYNGSHVVGTSGGSTADMREALALSGAGKISPAILVTHIGGLNAAKDATLHLPTIPGGKKLIYPHIDLPLTAIADFDSSLNPLLRALGEICEGTEGLWSLEAEKYLLAHASPL